ncbi:MAG: DoxX family protein [Bacteroidia bacterium]|nr:DoxX family protein [Bacteroidia bacterium]
MTEIKRSKALHITLWIAQVLLAIGFGLAGFMKVTAPIEQLEQSGMSFVNDYGAGMVRFIGISEILGALGLILPAALRIKPILTPIAAVGLSIIMILATIYHVSNNEPIVGALVFLALTSFVAWGRFSKASIQPK